MENQIIGIDTGNRCVKSANHVFVTGIQESDRPQPFQRGIVFYNDKYYMLSQSRVTYMQDKTANDDYFVMTLFAIVDELKTRGITAKENEAVPVILGVGLPPSHVPRLKEKFKAYFNRGTVRFSLDNVNYVIDIRGVYVFAQGYAAIYNDYAEISKYTTAYIIDIGGYTTDVIALSHGQIDPSFCQSLDMGLIQLYNKISWEIKGKYGFAPSEEQIDNVIITGEELSPKMPVSSIIDVQVSAYVDNMLRKLIEYGVDINFAKGVFVGGGAIRLRKWIELSKYASAPYFIENIHANARGYESFLYAMYK